MRKIPIIAGAMALITLLSASGVSAFFTDKQSVSVNLSVVSGAKTTLSESNFDENEASHIVPGQVITKDPRLTNDGGKDVYVFCEVQTPTVVCDGVATPIFSYEVDPGWGKVSMDVEYGVQKAVYFFGGDKLVELENGETTRPIFSEVKFVNPTRDNSLSGQDTTILVKMISGECEFCEEQTKDMTPSNILDIITAEFGKEYSIVDEVSKNNNFTIGDFNVNVKENTGDEVREKVLDKDVVIENMGNMSVVNFIKINPIYNSDENDVHLVENATNLISLGKYGGSYVFAINNALRGGEINENIFSEIEANCYISNSNIMSIQAEKLSDRDGMIDTDGTIDAATLQRIYELYNDESTPYFKDETIIESDGEAPDGVEIIENFPKPNPLVAGENIFVKEVLVKNISPYKQNVKIFLGFSDKEIEKKIQLSADGGKTYSTVDAFFARPPAGYSYKVENGIGYLYLNNALEPGERSPLVLTNVKVNFENAAAVRDFNVYVYAQSSRKEA